MQVIITGKLHGWQGLVIDNKNIISFGCYINSKGNLITPTLYYLEKRNKTNSDINQVRREILNSQPSTETPHFIKLGTYQHIPKA